MILVTNALYCSLHLRGTDAPTMHKKQSEFINMNNTEKKMKLMLHPSFEHSPLRYHMSFLVFWSYACDCDDNQWKGI